MRISDWSSDVCSSDLRFAPGAVLGGLHGRSIVVRERKGGALGVPSRRSRDARAARTARCGSPHGILARKRAVMTARCVRRERRSPARRCGDGRSEEHTSELHALMGFSYAVFALKTKKKN